MTAPQMPSRPQVEPARGNNWLGLLLAAMAAVIIFAGLFFLTQGLFGLVVLVGGGVFAMAAVHYVIWGRWLSRVLREEELAETSRNDNAHRDDPLRDVQRPDTQRPDTQRPDAQRPETQRQDELIRRGPQP